jgi:hypothetical protein
LQIERPQQLWSLWISITGLEIRWPSGLTYVFKIIASDQFLRVVEGDAVVYPVQRRAADIPSAGS